MTLKWPDVRSVWRETRVIRASRRCQPLPDVSNAPRWATWFMAAAPARIGSRFLIWPKTSSCSMFDRIRNSEEFCALMRRARCVRAEKGSTQHPQRHVAGGPPRSDHETECRAVRIGRFRLCSQFVHMGLECH